MNNLKKFKISTCYLGKVSSEGTNRTKLWFLKELGDLEETPDSPLSRLLLQRHKFSMVLSLVSSRDGASLAMLLTLEMEE